MVPFMRHSGKCKTVGTENKLLPGVEGSRFTRKGLDRTFCMENVLYLKIKMLLKW